MLKKKLVLTIITICLILSLSIMISQKINNTILVSSQSKLQGIEVTMLGESNMEENGNVNSCGYIVTTKNNKLIIVDGGRDIDAKFVLEYINKFGNGKVDYWFLTHPHSDHVGAMIEIIENENITVDNLCYCFNSLDWCEKNDKKGYETEKKALKATESPKVKNKIIPKKGQIIDIDNIKCEIIRIANPNITDSDNGNESSMVFKFTATDVDKSIIFLGDAYIRASEELLENPTILKADVVQMAHHGQKGVTKEVYKAIDPKICFFNAPKWLYDNDNGNGYNSGQWKSIEVRGWIQEIGAECICAFDGDKTLLFTEDEIQKK